MPERRRLVLNSRNKVSVRISASEMLTAKHTGVNMGRACFQSAVTGTGVSNFLNKNPEMKSGLDRKPSGAKYSSCTPDIT